MPRRFALIELLTDGRGNWGRFVVAAIAFLGFSLPVGAAQLDPVVLAGQIDHRIAARWDAQKVSPTSDADDATFVRRVTLDLIGRIPSVAEVRAFLDDKTPEKRAKLVARLVNSAAHARHAASFWRQQWVPQTNTPQFALLADELDEWIAIKLREGVSYDRLVRELLTVSRERVGADGQPDRGSAPTAFLAAGEFKPENLAANTTRAFLGINLDCAQCHNHPFARWTRDEFWQTAAFFARPKSAGTEAVLLRVEIPNTKQSVGPKLLTDPQPSWPETLHDETGRIVLANWVTAKNNPYFARNAVNRVWAEFFGIGIIEPLDDLSSENPPSHPELLDDLATAFASNGFDLKSLTMAIVLSKTYQLSSVAEPNDPPPDPQLFARSAVRGLTGEQLYASLRVAAGLPAERDDLDPANARRERRQFADKFRVERAGLAQRSILQSLSLMNSKLTAELTNAEKTPTLRAVGDAPFLDTNEKIETLFLTVLGRPPSSDEWTSLVKYAEIGESNGGLKQSLADIFWALLNSSEFNTNH